MELAQFITEQRCILSRQDAAGRVARSTAHEINNILQSLSVNLYFVREATSADSQAFADLVEAEKASNSLQGLAQQLRSLGRPADLAPLSVAAESLFLGAIEACRSRVPVALRPPELPFAMPRVLADAGAVRQAVEAILDNAVRYSGRTPPVVSAGIDVVAIGSELSQALPALKAPLFARLWIANEGQPFSPETRLRAWDPFFSTRENQRSAGQGLALVWRVISALGGFAHIHDVSTGARVSLFLPVADAPPSPAVAVRGLGEVLAAEG